MKIEGRKDIFKIIKSIKKFGRIMSKMLMIILKKKKRTNMPIRRNSQKVDCRINYTLALKKCQKNQWKSLMK